MDVVTRRMIWRLKVTLCAMTQMVIDRVELLASQKGYKSLKFLNRKKQEFLLANADLLEEMVGMITMIMIMRMILLY